MSLDVNLLGKEIVTLIVQRIATELRPLRQELERLQSRLTELDARLDSMPHVRSLADCYQGPWSRDRSYERGQLATDRGSCWLCVADTASRPGETGDWRLITKRGDAAPRERAEDRVSAHASESLEGTA